MNRPAGRVRAAVLAVAVVGICAGQCAAANLRIYCRDVGQGDATVILTPGNKAVVIDAGRKNDQGTAIADFIKAQGISRIEYLITTHYHDDHIAGTDTLVGRFVGTHKGAIAVAYDRGGTYSSTDYSNYVNALSTYAIPRSTIPVGPLASLDGVSLTCVCVDGHLLDGRSFTVSDENDRSVGVLVSYKSFDFLILGDAGSKVEDPLGEMFDGDPGDPIPSEVDVLRVSHHGSKTASSLVYLERILPEIAVISLGDSGTYGPGWNQFGHPAQETVDNLYAAGVRHIYQTQEGGPIYSASATPGRDYQDVDGDGVDDVTFTYADILIDTDGNTYSVAGDSIGATDEYEGGGTWPPEMLPQPLPAELYYYNSDPKHSLIATNVEVTDPYDIYYPKRNATGTSATKTATSVSPTPTPVVETSSATLTIFRK